MCEIRIPVRREVDQNPSHVLLPRRTIPSDEQLDDHTEHDGVGEIAEVSPLTWREAVLSDGA